VLSKVIADVAARSPAFAGQLQTLAQQANIQTGGAQGKVEISGEGKVYGPAVGLNPGTIGADCRNRFEQIFDWRFGMSKHSGTYPQVRLGAASVEVSYSSQDGVAKQR